MIIATTTAKNIKNVFLIVLSEKKLPIPAPVGEESVKRSVVKLISRYVKTHQLVR